ncbi:putative copper resistance protein D [Crossiella equi]|uniref:Copper resistance protein D n=1 Tax=Crossiella equi TaxID=130796 RepID=A0ABS5AFX9_9PSEU|nr:CopD family protein [Crossiella equi]MBP2475485.1 putative copper resistance protein D [Crossiella equi]
MIDRRAGLPHWSPLLFGVVVLAGVGVTAASVLTSVPVAPGVPAPPGSVRFALPALRLAVDACSVASVGLGVLPLLLRGLRPNRTRPVLVRAHKLGLGLGAVWALAALLLLWAQAAELAPSGFGLGTAELARYAAEVGAGRALLVAGACALATAVLHAASLRPHARPPEELPVLVALLGQLPLALTGHSAAAANHELALLSMSVHVMAASAWVGGLGVLLFLVVPERSLLVTALPRFAAVGTVCLCAVAVSGVVNAVVQLTGRPEIGWAAALLSTGYGWVVLTKTAALGVLAGLGGWLRFRLMPAVLRHRAVPVTLWLGLELLVMGLAIGLAAALARASLS